ncbi:GNAT family N-acetyltransferase [Vibrio ziniensis]|uniref:GNAT family N-acetyltransferase n=1 Tax=Vibrio ziniensis TaxID=2711221 RepID=A0A6G7CIM1_9VIBR|nr:GNAT family N-acetyltransferase [Vibrio ziniensis]QIH41896.1 GNAT family N-acetyltransferase [Vibrio ziniensis]
MDIILSQFKPHEHLPAFSEFKRYMKPIVDSAIGWDEDFQRSSFESRLQPEWFRWILSNGEKVGYVCSRIKSSSLHIHLLIIFEHQHRKGFASSVIKAIKSEANSQRLDLTLSCFKNNLPAANLYKQLKFEISSEDEHFYNFISVVEHS